MKRSEIEASLGVLFDLRGPERVYIRDRWDGYNERAPFLRVYDLARRGQGYEGTFTHGHRLMAAVKRDVTIDPMASRAFLDSVGGAICVPGPYEAHLDHTDDYPRIEIMMLGAPLDIGNRPAVLKLFTESQGDHNAPWQVSAGGASYVAAGDEIGRALAGLVGPLMRAAKLAY